MAAIFEQQKIGTAMPALPGPAVGIQTRPPRDNSACAAAGATPGFSRTVTFKFRKSVRKEFRKKCGTGAYKSGGLAGSMPRNSPWGNTDDLKRCSVELHGAGQDAWIAPEEALPGAEAQNCHVRRRFGALVGRL